MSEKLNFCVLTDYLVLFKLKKLVLEKLWNILLGRNN